MDNKNPTNASGNNINNNVKPVAEIAENNNKKIIYYSIIAVVIVAALIFWAASKKRSAIVSDSNKGQEVVVPTSTEDTTVGSVHTKKKAEVAEVSMTYDEALLKYRDSRIQLGSKCQAVPAYSTFKNNTTIMIDNRSNTDRVVKVGSLYPVKAYGFKIIKLEASTIPMQFLVDCDGFQNVATVLVQS